MDQEQKAHIKNEAIEWLKAILIAGVLVVVIRLFIFQPFVVDGPSMHPNFFTGERLIVNKLIYSIRAPKRGEVIVFLAPEGKDYIKRVIGMPGDTIKVDGDDVYVNGRKIAEPYIEQAVKSAELQGTTYNNVDYKYVNGKLQTATVPERQLFVMGDNRPNSKDSRYEDVGFVPYDKVVGRADFIFWPFKQIHFIEHSF